MKAGTAAHKVTNESDCAERILKIVYRLQQESKDRDADFQSRLKQAIEETRRRAEEQFRVLQERAVSEAQSATRKDVTEKLLSRFEHEMSKLQASSDRRLREAIAETEALAQLRLDSAVTTAKQSLREQMRAEARNEFQSKQNDAEKLTDQLKENARTAANEWQAERQNLQEKIATLERTLEIANAVRTEKLDDYRDLERSLQEAVQSKEQLQLDLQRAVSELNARKPSPPKDEPDCAAHGEVAAIVQSEMVRVRLHLDQIERTLADPATELGSEMRLNRERGELQAYLKGLRYSLGEVTIQSSTVDDPCRV